MSITGGTLILCGANRYKNLPGSTLSGCIHDLTSVYQWYAKHAPKGMKWVTLDDERDKKEAFLAALTKAIHDAKEGQRVHGHFSSHGTMIPVKGKNHGAIVHNDSTFDDLKTFTIDDEIKAACAKVKDGVQVLFTIDACNFGDSLRLVNLLDVAPTRITTPRFVQPPLDLLIEIDANKASGEEDRDIMPKGTNISSIAFCKRGINYTCADVRDSSGAYGAGTHFWIPELQSGVMLSQSAAREGIILTNNRFEQQPVFAGPDWPMLD